MMKVVLFLLSSFVVIIFVSNAFSSRTKPLNSRSDNNLIQGVPVMSDLKSRRKKQQNQEMSITCLESRELLSATISDILTNGDFETTSGGTATGWSSYLNGYTLGTGAGNTHGGTSSITANAGTSNTATYGAYKFIQLAQPSAAPILVSGWSKASNVGGISNSDYSIYIDIKFADDGDPSTTDSLYGQTANFSTGTHNWEYREILIQPTRLVTEVRVYLLFRNHSGQVWFDDIKVQQVTNPDISLVRFTDPSTPVNLLNGNFATTNGSLAASWNVYGTGYTLDATGGRNGTQGIKAVNTATGTIAGAYQNVTLNQTVPKVLQVSGWSKATNVVKDASGSASDYSVYIDVQYVPDGDPNTSDSLYGQVGLFNTGTHDWQKVEYLIKPTRAIKSFTILALFRNHTGTVLFDDFQVNEVNSANPTANLDNQAIYVPTPEVIGVEKLLNSNLESQTGNNATNWNQLNTTTPYVFAAGEGRNGSNAIKMNLTSNTQSSGAYQYVTLNQTETKPVVVRAWSKASSVAGLFNADYSVYVDVVYMDNTSLYGQVGNFNTGTHDWEQRELVIVPTKAIKVVRVYLLFRNNTLSSNHTGTVWFDDVEVKEVTSAYQTSDGLGLALTGTRVTGVQLDRNQNASNSNTYGGFLVRDAYNNSDFYATDSTGDIEPLGIQVNATYTANPNHIVVSGMVVDTQPTGNSASDQEDRAITVLYALPVSGEGWSWGEDLRTTETVSSNGEWVYTNVASNTVLGSLSQYPVAALWNSYLKKGIALGIDLNYPVNYRLAYNVKTQQLYLAMDIGLAAETKTANSASFRFIMYNFDVADGYRGAMQKYYDIFPTEFHKRVTTEGIWMPFVDIATIVNPQDFGFAFKEGDNNVSYDDANGYKSLVYIEPGSYWMPMTHGGARDYNALLAQLNSNLNLPQSDRNYQLSAASFISADQLQNGTIKYEFKIAPWNDGAIIYLNADPDIPTTTQYPYTDAVNMNNLITNSYNSWAGNDKTWRPLVNGGGSLDTTKKTGNFSLKISASALNQQLGRYQTVYLNQSTPSAVTLSGYSLASGVTGAANSDYSIFADITYTDNTTDVKSLNFNPTGSGWQQVTSTWTPPKAILKANVYVIFRNTHTGTAYFDDIYFGPSSGTQNKVLLNGFESLSATLDGVYVDSVNFSDHILNYARSQFAYVDTPLIYDSNFKVAQFGTFGNLEYVKAMATSQHANNKLVMGNGGVLNTPFGVPYFDISGFETKWIDSTTNAYKPLTDAYLLRERALSYQKPFVMLQNVDWDVFDNSMVKKYFERSLFYGMLPSMFSYNASSDNYWSYKDANGVNIYERDRADFVKYIPLIKTIASAGWKPVTGATSSNSNLLLERFGTGSNLAGSTAYLTVLNDATTSQTGTITVDLAKLGFSGSTFTAVDQITGNAVTLTGTGLTRTISVSSLASQKVMLIRIIRGSSLVGETSQEPAANNSPVMLNMGLISPVINEAKNRWIQLGVNQTTLDNLVFSISPLDGNLLAASDGNTITVDDDAAGTGWFIDLTPDDDSEFSTAGDQGEQGRYDLLTTLQHEIGHALGLEHNEKDTSVMFDTLETGERVNASSADLLQLKTQSRKSWKNFLSQAPLGVDWENLIPNRLRKWFNRTRRS